MADEMISDRKVLIQFPAFKSIVSCEKCSAQKLLNLLPKFDDRNR